MSPPAPAGFALTMLGHTPSGDAYTEAEYRQMLDNSGLKQVTLTPLAPMPETLVLATK